MSRSVVALIRAKDAGQSVSKAIELVGGLGPVICSRDKVLIKPNIVGGHPKIPGATTSLDVIRAVIRLLKGITNNIVIAESDATERKAWKAFRSTGLDDLAGEEDVTLLNVSEDKLVEVEIPKALYFEKVDLPITALESKRISIPVMKVCPRTGISVALKNMFGLLPDSRKVRYHPKINEVIADLNKVIFPHLSVVDGIFGLEGPGTPDSGKSVHLGVMLVGKDPVAVDSIAAKIMGVKLKEAKHIIYSSDYGLGEMRLENIEVRGLRVKEVERPFRKPRISLTKFIKRRLLPEGHQQ